MNRASWICMLVLVPLLVVAAAAFSVADAVHAGAAGAPAAVAGALLGGAGAVVLVRSRLRRPVGNAARGTPAVVLGVALVSIVVRQKPDWVGAGYWALCAALLVGGLVELLVQWRATSGRRRTSSRESAR